MRLVECEDKFIKAVEISVAMGKKLDELKEMFAELQQAYVDMIEEDYSKGEIKAIEEEIEYWRKKIFD